MGIKVKKMTDTKQLRKIGNLLDRVRQANVEDLIIEMNSDTSLRGHDKVRIKALADDFMADRGIFKQLRLSYANPEDARITYFAYLVITSQFDIMELYHKP